MSLLAPTLGAAENEGGGTSGKKNKVKFAPGEIAPKEGPLQGKIGGIDLEKAYATGLFKPGTLEKLGPNLEKLEKYLPDVVSAMRSLNLGYRVEGIVSRRWEARRIKQAHLFWMGIPGGYFNAADNNFHLPYGTGTGLGLGVEDGADEDYESPEFNYMVNHYQGFGLAFQALMTAKTPTPKFYPQSAQSEQDITTAKAADDVRKLNEKNNPPKKMARRNAWLQWCDGKIGGYVRWVVDGQRFGFDTVQDMQPDLQKMGEDGYTCNQCGELNPSTAPMPIQRPMPELNQLRSAITETGTPPETCSKCGGEIGEDDFTPADYVTVPKAGATRKIPRGQTVITLVPGLQFHTPPYAEERHEFPYLQWNLELHIAKLKASYPHAAEKITAGGITGADDVQMRSWRLMVQQGFPVTQPGDALASLATFSRTWLRSWAFWELDDKNVRDKCLALFPDGCYMAFAAEAYCEARNESMDKHWRVSHAMEGDGQNRPAVGDSTLQVNEQTNDLTNVEQEAALYGIPTTFADSETVNFDALEKNPPRPGDFFPAKVRPAETMGQKFFQTAPAELSQQAVARRQEMQGPVMQFLNGIQPTATGGDMPTNDTKGAYQMAREQALGRIGLFYGVWSNLYGELHLLGVECFRDNATEDGELPVEQEGGKFESKAIRLADLQGNIEVYEEDDSTFPALPSEVKQVLLQFVNNEAVGPMLIKSPGNIGTIRDTFGLQDYKIAGEDMRIKTMRVIKKLLTSQPMQQPAQIDMQTGQQVQPPPQATVQLDPELDDPTIAMAAVREWFQSDEGQTAEEENPGGLENVRAFYANCKQIAAAQAAQQGGGEQKPPSESISLRDLPPSGKVQMAAQAGIHLDPNELAAQEMQDRQDKADALRAKVAGKQAGPPAAA